MANLDIDIFMDNVKSGKQAFTEVLTFIEQHYDYTPTRFVNGDVTNDAGVNEGSAKVFGFAKLHQLSKADTLALFAEHYQNVLAHPDATDHANIRNFMQYGWEGVTFESEPLTPKAV